MKRIYSCVLLCAIVAVPAHAANGQNDNYRDAPASYPAAQYIVPGSSEVYPGSGVTSSVKAYVYPAKDQADNAFSCGYLSPLRVGAAIYTISNITAYNNFAGMSTPGGITADDEVKDYNQTITISFVGRFDFSLSNEEQYQARYFALPGLPYRTMDCVVNI